MDSGIPLVARTAVAALLATSIFAQRTPKADVPDLAPAAWTVEEVGEGVEWRSARFDDLFGAPQSLNVLVVALPPRTRRVRFASPRPFARVPTSRLATDARALAAVNGGFFDTSNGTPLGLLVIDGETVSEPSENQNVVLGVDAKERVRIEERGRRDWPEVEHALAAWPRILHAGAPTRPEGFGAKDRRHPRTAAGTTPDATLVLLTVDGRTPESAGMTLLELARTMQALGCEDAMNLDGGGSTTMWIRGRGVVNFPCDNKAFDHAGERAVANALLVLAPAIVATLDEDAAELTPRDAWELLDDDASHGGDHAVAPIGEATARFDVPPVPAGRYRLELRGPKPPPRASTVIVTVGEHDPVRVPSRRAAHRWYTVDEFEVPDAAPRLVVVLTSGGGALGVDAIRLVEVEPEDR